MVKGDNERSKCIHDTDKEIIFLGNMYGLHDGYDGSVFDPKGLCKTITRSVGGIADILVEYDGNNRQIKR